MSLTSDNMTHQQFQTGIVNRKVKESRILVHLFIAKYFQYFSMLNLEKHKHSGHEVTLIREESGATMQQNWIDVLCKL